MKLLIVLAFLCFSVSAAQVRGAISYTNPYNGYTAPAQGARVDFYYWTGYGWQVAATTFVGYDGMYYTQLPPGQFKLQINGGPVYDVYIQNYQVFDLPPISL